MSKLCTVVKKLSLAGTAFFVVTFAAYYFNLDMKLTAAWSLCSTTSMTGLTVTSICDTT